MGSETFGLCGGQRKSEKQKITILVITQCLVTINLKDYKNRLSVYLSVTDPVCIDVLVFTNNFFNVTKTNVR